MNKYYVDNDMVEHSCCCCCCCWGSTVVCKCKEGEGQYGMGVKLICECRDEESA